MVISGSKAGEVVVWQTHGTELTIRKQHFDHEAMINFIHINEDMIMYLTCGLDGAVQVYNLWTDARIRRFTHPKLAPVHSAVLTQTPLPALCFFSRDDHLWHSFSLNGSLLDRQKEECSHIIAP